MKATRDEAIRQAIEVHAAASEAALAEARAAGRWDRNAPGARGEARAARALQRAYRRTD